MRHAQTVPVLGSVLLVAALTAGGLYARPTHDRAGHRLVLHTYAEPDATYVSAWSSGEVFARVEPGKLAPLRFTQTLRYVDNCRWLGVETLEPIDERLYSYRYSETLLECPPGATAEHTRKTPRTGIVVVE
jgi:hypothetical protein